jgi:hypothetical protein
LQLFIFACDVLLHASFQHFHDFIFYTGKKNRMAVVGNMAVSQTIMPEMPRPPVATAAQYAASASAIAASSTAKPAIMAKPPSPTKSHLFKENGEGHEQPNPKAATTSADDSEARKSSDINLREPFAEDDARDSGGESIAEIQQTDPDPDKGTKLIT